MRLVDALKQSGPAEWLVGIWLITVVFGGVLALLVPLGEWLLRTLVKLV